MRLDAQFIVNDSIGCMPLDVTLTDYPAGAIPGSGIWAMEFNIAVYRLFIPIPIRVLIK